MLLLGFLLALFLAAPLPRAQGPEGTAVVRGRIVDGTTGTPLANVPVQFSPRPDHPYAPGIDVEPPSRSAITDSSGGFEVSHLAACDYAVSGNPPGPYLSAGYGETRPGGTDPADNDYFGTCASSASISFFNS